MSILLIYFLSNYTQGIAKLNTGSNKPEIPKDIEQLIELLFFAYRDFISDPDKILSPHNFGRAHHRVIHFVAQNPGLKVNELLQILHITRQSLGRVLKQLIDEGYIRQKIGQNDQRQRLLYPTKLGKKLSQQLSLPQSKRLIETFAKMPKGSKEIVSQFLYNMTNIEGREIVKTYTGVPKAGRKI